MEEKIKNTENKIKTIEESLVVENENRKTEEGKLATLKTSSEEKTWKIKTEYTGGDRVLEFCLTGHMGSKTNLFDYFSNISKDKNKPEKTIIELKKETEITQGKDAKKYNENEITKIDFDFSIIENNSFFSEVIIGNENSMVAGLIKELNNADWVKQGLVYTPEPIKAKTKCPFCQQETISQDLYNQIKNYFDAIYQSKLDKLKDLEKNYNKEIKNIVTQEKFLENSFIKSKENDFRLLYKNLKAKLSSNASFIKEKINKPSQVVDLESTLNEVNALNSFFDGIISEIKAHNIKIDNKEKTKIELKNNFWQIMRWEYDQTIEAYTTQKKSIEEEINKINLRISGLEENKKNERIAIEKAQKESINIDEAVKEINDGLKDLGTDGFQIEKVNDKYYQIKRNGKTENQFKTLSEGEKTMISFLYFLQKCKGKENENEVITSKIVVIDDPISSLSHIYIFNISQLIKFNFFEKPEFRQIFIFTHSLYFFHELIRYGKDDVKKLFRMVKSTTNCSDILSLSKDEIQNDYQAYWQVIKDHNKGNASIALLANSMRNVLEHFFGFIEKEKYKDSIEAIDSRKYQPFIRYIDRESHSDLVNISDTKEIDPVMFKEAFKEVFKKSGYESHYNKMMSIN
mgnify:CR=1 FL=1